MHILGHGKAVEKPCGKVCVECGKLVVFNSYPRDLVLVAATAVPCIGRCIGTENVGCEGVMLPLFSRGIFRHFQGKSWQFSQGDP